MEHDLNNAGISACINFTICVHCVVNTVVLQLWSLVENILVALFIFQTAPVTSGWASLSYLLIESGDCSEFARCDETNDDRSCEVTGHFPVF